MKLLLTFILIFSAATVILADISVPNTKKPTPSPTATAVATSKGMMQISVGDVDEPTLIIPQAYAKDFKASLENTENNSSVSQNNFAGTSTVVSGIYLSLAFVFGGVFLFKNKSPKAAVSLILLGICATSATIIYANVAPPQKVAFDGSFFSEKVQKQYRGVVGPIKVEVSASSAYFRLIVPPSKGGKTTNEE